MTAIKIYRSENQFAGFELISTIDLVESSDYLVEGSDASCMEQIYINSGTLEAYDIQNDFHLQVTVDDGGGSDDTLAGVATLRVDETGDGNKILTMTDAGSYLGSDWDPLVGGNKYPITAWNLTDVWDGGTLNLSGDGDDLQYDLNTICFNNANADQIKEGDIVRIDVSSTETKYMIVNKIIRDTDGNCSLGFTENIISAYTDFFSSKDFFVFTNSKTWAVVDYTAGSSVSIDVLDMRQAGIGSHPLDGEVSIQVNSKYGLYYKGEKGKRP